MHMKHARFCCGRARRTDPQCGRSTSHKVARPYLVGQYLYSLLCLLSNDLLSEPEFPCSHSFFPQVLESPSQWRSDSANGAVVSLRWTEWQLELSWELMQHALLRFNLELLWDFHLCPWEISIFGSCELSFWLYPIEEVRYPGNLEWADPWESRWRWEGRGCPSQISNRSWQCWLPASLGGAAIRWKMPRGV